MFIYGKNPIRDLFDDDPKKLKKVYISQKRHQSFYEELKNAKVPVFSFTDFNVNKHFNSSDNIQDIVAEIEEPKLLSLGELISKNKDKKFPVLLMLDQITDPQNFGAILRTAAAFDVDGVIVPRRGTSPITSVVMKASSGNWNKVEIAETGSFNQAIVTLKDAGYWIASTSLQANTSIDGLAELNQPLVIIMGSEGKGVRKTLIDKSDFIVKINMANNVESLNVSTATAIILHAIFEKKSWHMKDN